MPEDRGLHRVKAALLFFGVALGMLLLGVYLGRPGLQPPSETKPEVPSLPPLTVQSPAEQELSPVLPAEAPQPAPLPSATIESAPELSNQQPRQDPSPVTLTKPESEPEPAVAEPPKHASSVIAEKPVAVVEAPSAPKLMSELPDGFVSNMPKLNIDIHSFDERPQRSYVLINMEKYREGDYLAEGPLLFKILRDGVILEYMGERFILPIGNY